MEEKPQQNGQDKKEDGLPAGPAKPPPRMTVKMDELLVSLGAPGRFQVMLFILICLNYCPLTFNHICMAFYGATPPHQCSLILNSSDLDAGPQVYRGPALPGLERDKCQATVALGNGTNTTLTCSRPGQWSYQPLPGENTIVMEWDLVCDNGYLSSLATTIYFLGVMVGGLVFGYLSDRFGRRPIMLMTLYLPVAVGVGIAFVQNYILFAVLRFIQGFLMQGLQISSYVLAMELLVPSHRPIGGAVVEVFWGLGVLVFSGMAFLFPNWRHLQLAISVPSVLALVYICIMPESLRWLISKRNHDEQAEKLLERVCRFNKRPVPMELYQQVKTVLDKQSEAGSQTQFTHWDLLKTSRLRKRSFILFYLWLSVAVGYYGLLLKITSLAGNKYLNFFIGAVVEFCAYVIAIPVFKFFGRKKPLICFASLAAVTCIVAGSIPSRPDLAMITTGFAIAGRFAMGGFFSVMFLYTSELYPTVIRNLGLGSCAFWARVGGVLAPQVNNLARYTAANVPVIIFGVMTLIAAIVAFFLPETHGKKLPDAIIDVEGNFRQDDEFDEISEEKRKKEESALQQQPVEITKL